jgi:hypothetical protein
MPIKKVAHRVEMVKKGDKKMALKWVPSSFDEPNLKNPEGGLSSSSGAGHLPR